MKNYYLITTQYLENYGAHCDSGKFSDGKACWKYKGGGQYLISTDSPREANAVAFLTDYLQKGNDIHSKELVVGWEQIGQGYTEPRVDGDYKSIDIEEYFNNSVVKS